MQELVKLHKELEKTTDKKRKIKILRKIAQVKRNSEVLK